MMAIRLRVLGFLRLYNESGHPEAVPAGKTLAENRISDAKGTARLVRLAARHGLYHPSCLEQSLAILWLLRREGIAAELRIGVRKEAGQLLAHAWVECLGFPLNETADNVGRYRQFDLMPAPWRVKFQ